MRYRDDRDRVESRTSAGLLLAMLLAAAPAIAQTGRFLAKEDILIYGLGLRVDPVTQTVPKDIATIVSTYLQAPQVPPSLPPFAPDAVVKGTLRGPGLQSALDLQTAPNSPFNIPPLTVAGTYTLENIRLESQGAVLLRSTPESVTITVIDKLLVTQITARAADAPPRSARRASSSTRRTSRPTTSPRRSPCPTARRSRSTSPCVLPSVQSVADTHVAVRSRSAPAVQPPAITSLKTVIPDTLKLATQIPNLTVVGFQLKVPELQGQNLIVPPIPGRHRDPGRHRVPEPVLQRDADGRQRGAGRLGPQRHEPAGGDHPAAGNDRVANSVDDPLRMAMTARGESPRLRAVVQAGPDGQLGHRRRHHDARAGRERQRRVPRRGAARGQPHDRDEHHRDAARPARRAGGGHRPRGRRGARPQPDVHADLHAPGDRGGGRALHARRHRHEHVRVAGELRQRQPVRPEHQRRDARRRPDPRDREHPAGRFGHA